MNDIPDDVRRHIPTPRTHPSAHRPPSARNTARAEAEGAHEEAAREAHDEATPEVREEAAPETCGEAACEPGVEVSRGGRPDEPSGTHDRAVTTPPGGPDTGSDVGSDVRADVGGDAWRSQAPAADERLPGAGDPVEDAGDGAGLNARFADREVDAAPPSATAHDDAAGGVGRVPPYPLGESPAGAFGGGRRPFGEALSGEVGEPAGEGARPFQPIQPLQPVRSGRPVQPSARGMIFSQDEPVQPGQPVRFDQAELPAQPVQAGRPQEAPVRREIPRGADAPRPTVAGTPDVPGAGEVPGNVRMIGGEMLLWSDLSDESGMTDWRGVALELIRRVLPPRGRVLMVGPHPEALVDEVVTAASTVAIVLRSYPDACSLGARHPGLEVSCGRLEAFEPREPYDLVLALDGVLRTHSAEAPAASWAESVSALARLVAPGGRLVLGVRNDLGVDRLLEARPDERAGGDDQWAPHGFDVTYPSGPQALDRGLEDAGLAVERFYGAYPGRRSPRALVAREALARLLPDSLAVPLSAGDGDRMSVADPLQLTRLAFRHRLGAELAPLWLTVALKPDQPQPGLPQGEPGDEDQAAHRPSVHERPAEERPADEGPAGEGTDGQRPAHEPQVHEPQGHEPQGHEHQLQGPQVHERPREEQAPETSERLPVASGGPAVLVPSGAAGTVTPAARPVVLPLGLIEDGGVVHELTRRGLRGLPDGGERPVPRGRVVEEVLVEACAREDVRAVRELLAALAEWLETSGDATVTTDTLVWDGRRFSAIPLTTPPVTHAPDPSDRGDDEARVVLCRVLWRFAVRLLAAGHHHPWPWPLDPEQLTLTLCGMAGRPCDTGDLDRARKLDTELGRPAELPAGTPTYRDLLGARDRLADQLTAALSRVSRLETKLSYRERELSRTKAKLKRSQRKAAAYRRTLGFRLTRRFARPRKVARRVMRLLSG
ncbi:hypothetical protein SAMN05660976_04157 [Nonomuraea pusilla]|uniref:Methyltransferase domain-containing protein n=2 Tax=Nonomuraea pusilla TaxID=46177 RepID=A0A1H7VIM4_9ACTN|nr:hypothetical protein SAMN05660976_04157 [Nonomuraea pusilla]